LGDAIFRIVACIVGSHFGAIPILRKWSQPAAQIGRWRFRDPSFAKIASQD
jgi:hypothetical protein